MSGPTFDHALTLSRCDRWVDAESICLEILADEPAHAGALRIAGEAAIRAGNLQLAAQRLLRAARAEGPSGAGAALEPFVRAIEREPRRADLHHWRAAVLEKLELVEDAIAAYRCSIAVDATQPGTQYCLAEALMRRAVLDDAIVAYRETIRLIGGMDGYRTFLANAHSGLGHALLLNGQQEEAIRAFRAGLALAPSAARHSQLLFCMQYWRAAGADLLGREAREWDKTYARPLASALPRGKRAGEPSRRLRVGYVSNDFRTHTHINFLPPLFELHDREKFEIIGYSSVADPDDVTTWLRARADGWRDISRMDDDAAARLVRDDAVDVLVDLTMHTGGGRLLLFARAPSPVQVCWLAYPGTTGMMAMDYRVTDSYLDPPALDGDSYSLAYTERAMRLPETFWCYRPQHPSLEIGPLPATTAGCVTFGCLNNFAKVDDAVLDLWARVLLATPDSRAILLVPSHEARRRVRQRFQRSGVDTERVEFVGRQPLLEYLANYRRIDIGLDTSPYGGHTTSLEAFYMGVPIVTQVGTTIVGRAGLGFATNLGLPGLVAKTDDEYVRIASDLARDVPRLSDLRAGLRARMKASPLMDEVRFVRRLEDGYRGAWAEACGRPAAPSRPT